MYNLLMSEPPLQCQPSLAKYFGSADKAIVLQQIHYWLQRSENIRNGHKWVYNSAEDWQKQFSWMSVRKVQRLFKEFEDQGILISGNFNRKAFDRTKWYTIDYDAISKIGKSLRQNDVIHYDNLSGSLGQNDVIHYDKMSQPIPLDYPENTSIDYRHPRPTNVEVHSSTDQKSIDDEDDEKNKNDIPHDDYWKIIYGYSINAGFKITNSDLKRLIALAKHFDVDTAVSIADDAMLNEPKNPVAYLAVSFRNAIKEQEDQS